MILAAIWRPEDADATHSCGVDCWMHIARVGREVCRLGGRSSSACSNTIFPNIGSFVVSPFPPLFAVPSSAILTVPCDRQPAYTTAQVIIGNVIEPIGAEQVGQILSPMVVWFPLGDLEQSVGHPRWPYWRCPSRTILDDRPGAAGPAQGRLRRCCSSDGNI